MVAAPQPPTAAARAKAAAPSFKQYREADGLFYFKLLDADGRQLLQSKGFASPQEAGRAIGTLRQQQATALAALLAQLEPIDEATMRAATAALDALAEQTAGDKR